MLEKPKTKTKVLKIDFLILFFSSFLLFILFGRKNYKVHGLLLVLVFIIFYVYKKYYMKTDIKLYSLITSLLVNLTLNINSTKKIINQIGGGDELYDEPDERDELYDEPDEELYDEPDEELYDEPYEEPEELYDEPYEEPEELYDEPEKSYDESDEELEEMYADLSRKLPKNIDKEISRDYYDILDKKKDDKLQDEEEILNDMEHEEKSREEYNKITGRGSYMPEEDRSLVPDEDNTWPNALEEREKASQEEYEKIMDELY